ncbi:unnamed protein product [Clavelina lepadiformis]|uniref:Uncharacterized protein n=1 Tax=Clavelina lepadiformis TaxID=159417 RepID=A0ABP0FRT9_CLALP
MAASDIVEKKLCAETLKSQLAHFRTLAYDDWVADDNDRRYVSLLCELKKYADKQLILMAADHFPIELNLDNLYLSTSEATGLSEILRKQNNLKELVLTNCFSPGDVELVISAIVDMPGKVKWIDISDNIIKEIPGLEFFAKVEDKLEIFGCFDDGNGGRRDPNEYEKQKIQLILDELHDSKLKVDVGDGACLCPGKH